MSEKSGFLKTAFDHPYYAARGTLLALGVGACVYWPRFSQSSQKPQIEDDLDTIRRHRDILTMKEATKKSEKLSIRSTPNDRLVQVFDINNMFTTMNQERAITFRTQATKPLNAAWKSDEEGIEDWDRLKALMTISTRDEIIRLGNEFMLDTLIRNITMQVSIEYLFPYEIKEPMNPELVERVARNINILWIDSKDTAHIASPGVQERKAELFDDLKELIRFNRNDDSSNPLNLILPAYETMWRVVKMGFLELYCHDGPERTQRSHHFIDDLGDFFDGRTKFNGGDDESLRLCPRDTVKEILRLYPPARQVYRRFPGEDEDKIADIGACHLLSPLGGSDPNSFRPSRWTDIREDFIAQKPEKVEKNSKKRGDGIFTDLKDCEMHLGFMPFGEACPAGFGNTRGFGFKMIGLLTASLLRAAEAYGLEVEGPFPEKDARMVDYYKRSRGDGRRVTRKATGSVDVIEEQTDQDAEELGVDVIIRDDDAQSDDAILI